MPFGLWNKKVQVTVDRQKQVDIIYATRRLEQGNLSFILGDANLVDGSPILSLHDVSLLEPKPTPDSFEGTGVKRMVKGLYSFGQGQKEDSGEKLVQIDRGTMTIAGSGIEFAGKVEKLIIGFDNIEVADHTHNEIMIATKSPARRLHFEGIEKTVVPLKVRDRAYQQPLSGKVLQLMIKAMMTRVDTRGRG